MIVGENVTWNMSSGPRRIATGRIRDRVFAASEAGPAGRVVHAPKSWTGMPSLRYPQSISSASISPRLRTA